MASANASPIVVCGQGRIGSALLQRLQQQGRHVLTARISAHRGLSFEQQAIPPQIQTLLICIAPGGRREAAPKWLWRDIFSGLSVQLHSGELQVEQLAMVSSTRVYESVSRGIVSAQTTPLAHSENGQELIAAEHMLLNLPTHTLLLRASGLYGELYPVYTPILQAGENQPRFGVEAIQVIERLFAIAEASERGDVQSGIELMTDGKVYYQGHQWSWPEQRRTIEPLAKEFRILINSQMDLPSV